MTVKFPPSLEPLLQCHFFSAPGLFSATPYTCECFLCSCLVPPGLLLFLLLCLLPQSGHPLLPPMLDICLCVPKLKFRNTVSGNLYLPHSSAFLRTHCHNNKQRCFFRKNKILKYKVSQVQLETALNNCEKYKLLFLKCCQMYSIRCQIPNDVL